MIDAFLSETCQHCLYWVQVPIDPNNVTAERPGECLGGPPAMIVLPVPGGLQITPRHPLLGGNERACGVFKERLALQLTSVPRKPIKT